MSNINGYIDAVSSSGAVYGFANGFSSPHGLALDSSGNLYVANASGTISEITPTGTVSTFISSGLNQPYSLAFNSSGDLYVGQNGNSNILEYSSTGSLITTYTLSTANAGLAVDSSGNLFAAYGSNIYKITPGGVESTFATGLSNASCLVFDTSGNLYESNYGTNTINKFTSGGVESTFATGFNSPAGLAIDSNGNLYVVNINAGDIVEITPGGVKSTFATGLTNERDIAFEVTPEPSTWALLIFGGVLLLFVVWQQKRKAVCITRTVL